MTEKRFELKWRDTGEVLYDNETGLEHGIYSPDYRFHVRDMMNEFDKENKELLEKNQLLNEKNQLLNEKEKDMVNYLKKEYEYIYDQRMKHLDDAVLVICYEMIEYHIRSMIEHLEGL